MTDPNPSGHPDEPLDFESMSSAKFTSPGDRFVARALNAEHEAEIRDATQGLDASMCEPFDTGLADTAPHFIGPLIRPYDAVIVVGQPGSGKSTAVSDWGIGSYLQDDPTCMGKTWPIDTSYQHGRTFVLNGETTPKHDWGFMLQKSLIARNISPKSAAGEFILQDRFRWGDPQLMGWGLDQNDEFRESRVLRLADELAKAECSMLVMDPVFAIFGAEDSADLGWVFHGLNPMIKALKERNITTILISHPSGAAEAGKASFMQQFSPHGSKQQLAIIDCHIGIKRDSKDLICIYNRKTRRADWIPKNTPLKLTKGHPAGYLACDETNLKLWPMESPEGLPLPDYVLTLMKQLPATMEPFRKPDEITPKRMTRSFEGWLHPFNLLEREAQEHEKGQPYFYTWSKRGLKEREKL